VGNEQNPTNKERSVCTKCTWNLELDLRNVNSVRNEKAKSDRRWRLGVGISVGLGVPLAVAVAFGIGLKMGRGSVVRKVESG